MKLFISMFMRTRLWGGALCYTLRCHMQRRKRYAGGRDCRWQIPNRRPLSDRSLHIEARRQVGHWE